VATQFLTRIPVASAAHFRPQWLSRSLRYFPLVGALVGLLNVAAWWLASRWFPPAVAVGLMLSASLLITGALHEDGFADACDGFGGGTSAEQTLAIMKDSRLGAYGAIGIFTLLGLKWAALTGLPPQRLPVVVLSAHVVSRWCAIALVWGLRYARPAEEGKSRPFAGALSAAEWSLSGLLGLLAVAIFALATGVLGAVLRSAAELAGLLAAGIVAGASAAYFRRRIGGYTGDCLGATQQLCELAFVLAALAVLRHAAQLS
jgi:adenosylcobinamide-GDP ribazoletransferase